MSSVIAKTSHMDQLKLSDILTNTDPAPSYLVENLFYRGQVVVIAGEPGVGKSFLQYTLAMSLASGLNFLNIPSHTTKVLYFDEENAKPDLQQYLRQIWRGLGKPSIANMEANLFIQHFALDAQAKERYRYMIQLAAKIKPGLIVIDTVTPVCAIEDENHNGEASKAMRQLRRVKEAAGPDCVMILLKHAKFSHDTTERQTIRGAKSWLGEADCVIYHKLAQGKPRSDGLRDCRLFPDKVRAFGLRTELKIVPSWIGDGSEKGIILNPLPGKPGI